MINTNLPNLQQNHLNYQSKTKRSSKISLALKNRFLSILKQKGNSIKSAANRLRINYSTAKVIAREQKFLLSERTTWSSEHEQQQYLPFKQKKQKVQQHTARCSSFVFINNSQKQLESNLKTLTKIQIISTISFTSIGTCPTQQNYSAARKDSYPETSI